MTSTGVCDLVALWLRGFVASHHRGFAASRLLCLPGFLAFVPSRLPSFGSPGFVASWLCAFAASGYLTFLTCQIKVTVSKF